MDDLRAEFQRLKSRKDSRRRADLRRFQERLGRMRFFDPACGCGNFLIIAYRELRRLEIEVIRERRRDDRYAKRGAAELGQEELDASMLSMVNVDQFYGIEISEFPARIAETAMWMMDHIMNDELGKAFGLSYARIPLEAAPTIFHGDALEMDWTELLPPKNCSYVFGNPPFIGQSYQTPQQRKQMRRIVDPKGKRAGSLDYVAAWFIKASEYVKPSAKVGFVATNSITQGEQVAQLWPTLFDQCEVEIGFAHRTFAWGSDARGKAQVHVVILGLECRESPRREKRLFTYPNIKGEPEESVHEALSPYLFDAGGLSNPHLIVREESQPINGLATPRMGTKPVVGKHYLFSRKEKAEFIAAEPGAADYFRPFVGARELLQGEERYIMHLDGASPSDLAKLPMTKARIAAVKKMRSESSKAATKKLAEFPTRYEVSTVPDSPFLVIPETSSERREYVPIGYLEPPDIPSNAVRIVENATPVEFALLTSAMHMAWLRHIGGRLKSDYRYSIGLVYNTFPTPTGFSTGEVDLAKLELRAKAVLDARAEHSDSTLANLYDPDLMPANLREMHQALDHTVDRLYRRKVFSSERERIEHLFALYEKMRNEADRRKGGKLTLTNARQGESAALCEV